MIKGYLTAPAIIVMAALTLFSLGPIMNIVGTMAGITISGLIMFMMAFLMTLTATYLFVFVPEWKIRVTVMIESDCYPIVL
jgi:hypothetical protein